MKLNLKKISELGKKSKGPIVKKERFVKIKKLIEINKEKISFIKDVIIYSISYGIPINYMLWGVFGIKFGIFSFPAYGILFYLIKEEFPEIRMKIFPITRK